ncbi:MAG: hypothetical protein JWP81_2103 [Ferruginibacter sp.]|nr:hypothetical protein [Ferruginibacter sp.]
MNLQVARIEAATARAADASPPGLFKCNVM